MTQHYQYSCATLIGTPCVLPLEGPIIWKVPLTEKALFYVINVPAKTSVQPKPGPVIWKVPISKVPITVARLYCYLFFLLFLLSLFAHLFGISATRRHLRHFFSTQTQPFRLTCHVNLLHMVNMAGCLKTQRNNVFGGGQSQNSSKGFSDSE
jgi:hypothetical protein